MYIVRVIKFSMKMIKTKSRWEVEKKGKKKKEMKMVRRERTERKEMENGGSVLEGWAVGARSCACA